MVVYDSILEVPSILTAGKYYIKESGLPYDIIHSPGDYAMIVDANELYALGMMDQAAKDQDGNTILMEITYYPTIATTRAIHPPPTPLEPITITAALVSIAIFIKASFSIIACLIALAIIAYTVCTIISSGDGKTIAEYADGTKIYEAGNGAIYRFNPDGSVDEISPPTPPLFGDLGTIVKYAVIATAVIGVGYVGMQAYSSIKHKKPFQAPAVDYAVQGASGVAQTGAKAGARLLGSG